MSSYTDLNIPASNSTVIVKAMNLAGSDSCVPASFFLEPVVPGSEGIPKPPFYSFLIEHSTHGRVLFDLGIRKDSATVSVDTAGSEIAAVPKETGFSPAMQGLLAYWASMDPKFKMTTNGDIAGHLKEGGVPLDSVKAVIWSHSHTDHIGDMSTFPASTNLVVGPGADLKTYPQFPEATLVEGDISGRKIEELSFEDAKLRIAELDALDYFNDGSLYILNTPGHCPGHICALARTTPDSFVFLGGDICHHPGQLRPTSALHAAFPCPSQVVESARQHVSPAYFDPLDVDGKFNVKERATPMFDIGSANHPDIATAQASLKKATTLDASPDILTLIAHDASTTGVIDQFPLALNGWKEKGWKERLLWAFLDEKNLSFIFSEKE
ncbi:Metallo-hydrolase/oxidoreductase [Cylindrobasidium torrendii FP15055 ss-10]|uniref:Metallo-hydrolase/oxidoreductase n=1 Tax=Cylindrobasidium torrendii FP15055 ss-10 TaxID=1314674 RepID=A0A0D7B261_9AGAR|nr:Metallo-hydrolase/oxidoreductase [Cylindrobasidium torrendii FP15055 ss-10]